MFIRKIDHLKAAYKTNSHIRKVFSNYSKKEHNGKNILIYAGIGHLYISYFENLLYHLLIKEGYKVDFLVYDENIKINERITKSVIDSRGKENFWNKNIRNSFKLLEDSNVSFETIDASRKEVDNEVKNNSKNLEDIFNYKIDGVQIGIIVKNTMFKYYRSLNFDNDALDVAKKFLHTALTNYHEIKTRSQNKKYEYVLFSHGIYVTWGPVAEFCKKNNLNFISYDRAKSKNTININFNQVSPDWSFNLAWEKYKNKSLNNSEKEKVAIYLKDRELQKNDVYAYNFSNRSDNIIELKNDLGIPLESKVITIFTNLIWDAANIAKDLAFESAFACLTETIEYYKNSNDVHVVLRSHPAEKIVGTKERYGSLLRKYFKNKLPDNVTIIEPEMAVNSFSVIDISDIGVVNTSTVGLEFALLGKPIVLISETHYRNKGFTYDVDSSIDYFDTINKLLDNSKLKLNQKYLAEKYFYMMMFKYQHRVPLEYEGSKFVKYSYDSLEKLSDAKVLSQILHKIMGKEKDDFIFWD